MTLHNRQVGLMIWKANDELFTLNNTKPLHMIFKQSCNPTKLAYHAAGSITTEAYNLSMQNCLSESHSGQKISQFLMYCCSCSFAQWHKTEKIGADFPVKGDSDIQY